MARTALRHGVVLVPREEEEPTNSTPKAPRSSEPADDDTVENGIPAGEAPVELAGADAAEQFHHAVEQRLSDQASGDPVPDADATETELDEHIPMSVDNP